MKSFDRYKISLHNIKNNKSRSILTTIIVYIISLLIMVILCIGISFSSNTQNIIRKYYQESGEAIYVTYNNYGYGDGPVKLLDVNAYSNLPSILEEYEDLIQYSKYDYNSMGNSIVVQEHKFPISGNIEILEGRNVNPLDSNTNKVLVSADYAQKYYDSTGDLLKPGDSFNYSFEFYTIGENYNSKNNVKNLTFEVAGIFEVKEDEDKKSYEQSLVSSSAPIIADAAYLINNVPSLYYTSLDYYHNVTKTNFNSSELTDKLDGLVNALSDTLPNNDPRWKNVSCYALDDLKMSSLIGTIIIGFASFLCLVLILLSIGSLANTIMISVDKNKKFIGLLKALGLNEKDLKSTIKLESITTIVLGVLLSFGTVFLFKGIVGDLNELLLSSMFATYLNSIEYSIIFSLPIYVPIIVLIFFIFFTLLFARGSMSKIAKTDPMAVISEVA